MPSDGTLSQLTIPVLISGTVSNKTYDLPGGGGDVSGKADKVTNATSGNFAGLDSNGNLTDSGKKASDFANSSHTHTKSQITDFPTLGTAASKDVPSSGNATTTQVVMGNDSRLSDARSASDVYSWAKAASKPSYTASEVGAIATTAKGAASGVAELDANGKVPSSQLPSYVDDVLEYASQSAFPSTGETGKIYIAQDTNKTYRWSGTAYVEISASLALGETSSTAYYGDKGKTAYNHSQTTSGNPHNVTKSDVGLGNVGNFKAVSTVASQGLSDTEKSNARANIGAGTGSGTITGITMNGSSKGTSGVVDLGTVITSHQDISGKADKPTVKSQSLAANATSVTFTGIPTSGNNMIDFFITDGANYTAINTATSGQITLTYAASSSARTVYCRIEGV